MSQSQDSHEVTRLLARAAKGEGSAAEELLPLVYNELRLLAGVRMANEPPNHTLQATSLVHEAYLRLVGTDGHKPTGRWDSRGHFFGAAAEAMRRILVDHARGKARVKRGGGRERVDADVDSLPASPEPTEILAADEALSRIEERDPRMGEVIKLRFFAGLSIADTARVLEVSERTVRREWTFAKAWLTEALGDGT